MKKLLLILVLVVMCSSVARSSDVNDAAVAYDKGNYAQALDLFRALVAKEVPSTQALGQYFIGRMYNDGEGVTQDYKEAEKWYRTAAKQGLADAQYNLGLMHESGVGVTQDYEEAAKWYRAAAEQGLADAKNNLGLMYDNGRGVLQDYILAHMWYNLSASNGGENKNRDSMAKEMFPAQIVKAQEMARDCKKKNYQSCD
jgi:uncharacterized protein